MERGVNDAKEEGELSDDDDVIIVSPPPTKIVKKNETETRNSRTSNSSIVFSNETTAKKPIGRSRSRRSRNRTRRNSLNYSSISAAPLSLGISNRSRPIRQPISQNAPVICSKSNNASSSTSHVPSLLSLNVVAPTLTPSFLLRPPPPPPPPLPTIPPPDLPEPPPLHLPPNSPRPRKHTSKELPDAISNNVESLGRNSPPAGDVEDPDYIDLLLEYQRIRKQLAQITQDELSEKNKSDQPSGDQKEGVQKSVGTPTDKGAETIGGAGDSFHDKNVRDTGKDSIKAGFDKSHQEEEELDILQLRLNALKSFSSESGKVPAKVKDARNPSKRRSSVPRKLPFAPCSLRSLRSLPRPAKRPRIDLTDRHGNPIRPLSWQRRDIPRRRDVDTTRRRSEDRRRDDRKRSESEKRSEEKKKQQVQYEMNQRRLEVQKILTLDDPKEQYTRFMELVAGVENSPDPVPAVGVVKDNYEPVEMDLDSDVEPTPYIQTAATPAVMEEMLPIHPVLYQIPGLDISPPKVNFLLPNTVPGHLPIYLQGSSDIDYLPAFKTDLGSSGPPTCGFTDVIQSDSLYTTDYGSDVTSDLLYRASEPMPLGQVVDEQVVDVSVVDVSDDDSTVAHHIPGLGWHNEPSDILKICEDHANSVTEQLHHANSVTEQLHRANSVTEPLHDVRSVPATQPSTPLMMVERTFTEPMIIGSPERNHQPHEEEDEEAMLRAKLLKSLLARKKIQEEKSSSSGASSPKAVGHEQEMETLSEPSVSSQSQAKEPSNASPSSVVRTKALRVAPAKPKSDPQSLAHREPSQIVNKNSSPAHQATIHAQDILSEMSQMRTSDSRAATAPQKQTAKTASLINSKKFPVVTERPLVARNSPVLRISSPVLSSIPSPLASGESEVFGYESPGSVTIDVALSEDQIMANSGQPWKPAALEKSNNKDLLRYSHQHRQYYKVPRHKPVVIRLGDDTDSEDEDIQMAPGQGRYGITPITTPPTTDRVVNLVPVAQSESLLPEVRGSTAKLSSYTNKPQSSASFFPGNLDSFLKEARKTVENEEQALKASHTASTLPTQAPDVPKRSVTTPEAIKNMPLSKIAEYKKLKERLQQSRNTSEVNEMQVELLPEGSTKADDESNSAKQKLEQIDAELMKQRHALGLKQDALDSIKREITKKKSILRMGEEHVQKLREQLAAAEKIVSSNRKQIENNNAQAQDAQAHVDEKKARVQALEAQQTRVGRQAYGDSYKPGVPEDGEKNLKVTIGKGAQGSRHVVLPATSVINQSLSPARKVVVVSTGLPTIGDRTDAVRTLDMSSHSLSKVQKPYLVPQASGKLHAQLQGQSIVKEKQHIQPKQPSVGTRQANTSDVLPRNSNPDQQPNNHPAGQDSASKVLPAKPVVQSEPQKHSVVTQSSNISAALPAKTTVQRQLKKHSSGKQSSSTSDVLPAKPTAVSVVQKSVLREQPQAKASKCSEMAKEKARLVMLERKYAEMIRRHKESQAKTSVRRTPPQNTALLTNENAVPVTPPQKVLPPGGGGAVWNSLHRTARRRRTESIMEHVATEELMEVTGVQAAVAGDQGGQGDGLEPVVANKLEPRVSEDESRTASKGEHLRHTASISSKGASKLTAGDDGRQTSSFIPSDNTDSGPNASPVKGSHKALSPIPLTQLKKIKKQHKKLLTRSSKRKAVESQMTCTITGPALPRLNEAPASVISTKDEVMHSSPTAYKAYCSSLLKFRGYRLNPYFRTKARYNLSSLTFSHQISPNKIMCQFGLTGKCNDDSCSHQHYSEYQLSQAELLKDMLTYCPKLCADPNWDAKVTNRNLDELVDSFLKSHKHFTDEELRILFVSQLNEAGKRVLPHILETDRVRLTPAKDPNTITPSQASSTEELTSTNPPKHDCLQTPDQRLAEPDVRYWSTEAVCELEARLIDHPRDTSLWLQLAYYRLNHESNKENGLNQALNVMARSLESNRSCSTLWLHYLQLYEQKRDATNISGLYKQAVKYSPCFEIFWKYIQRTKSFDRRQDICTSAIDYLSTQSGEPKHSHQILQIIIHMVAMHVDLRDFQQGLNMVKSKNLKCSSRLMVGLTPEDRLVVRSLGAYMYMTQSFPCWIYSPSGLPKDCPVYKDLLLKHVWWSGIFAQMGQERTQKHNIEWAVANINQSMKAFRSEMNPGEEEQYKPIWSILHKMHTDILFLKNCDIVDIVLPLRHGTPPGHIEDSDWYIPIIESATRLHLSGEVTQNHHKINELCSEALDRDVPSVKLYLVIITYKMAVGDQDHALELLENCVLSIFDCDMKNPFSCDPNLLYCKLLGEPLPLTFSCSPYKKSITPEWIKEQTPYIWQCYCLLFELQGFTTEPADTYEAAILSVRDTKHLTHIWTRYLHQQYRLLLELEESDQMEAYSRFTALVMRCLTTLPVRVPMPYKLGEMWDDYTPHNTILMLYLETYPSDGDALLKLYERLVRLMPHNVPLIQGAVEHFWNEGHRSLALGHCITALDDMPNSRELWTIYFSLLRSGNDREKPAPSQMRNAYQRATKYLPLDAELWKDWALYELTEHNMAGLQYVIDRCTLPEADLPGLVHMVMPADVVRSSTRIANQGGQDKPSGKHSSH